MAGFKLDFLLFSTSVLETSELVIIALYKSATCFHKLAHVELRADGAVVLIVAGYFTVK